LDDCGQGDLIGRIFVFWAIVFCGHFWLLHTKVAPKAPATFNHGKSYVKLRKIT
jgi:hypothetical protein